MFCADTVNTHMVANRQMVKNFFIIDNFDSICFCKDSISFSIILYFCVKDEKDVDKNESSHTRDFPESVGNVVQSDYLCSLMNIYG